MTEETMVARLRAFADRQGIKLKSWHGVYKDKADKITRIEIALASNLGDAAAQAIEWQTIRPHRVRLLSWVKGRTTEVGGVSLCETFGHKERSDEE